MATYGMDGTTKEKVEVIERSQIVSVQGSIVSDSFTSVGDFKCVKAAFNLPTGFTINDVSLIGLDYVFTAADTIRVSAMVTNKQLDYYNTWGLDKVEYKDNQVVVTLIAEKVNTVGLESNFTSIVAQFIKSTI